MLISKKLNVHSEPTFRTINKTSLTTFSVSSDDFKECHPNTDRKLNVYKSDEYLLLDVGIEEEFQALKDTNVKYETLQQYVNYEDLIQRSSLSSRTKIVSDSCDYTTCSSSQHNIRHESLFVHKLIQTDYDAEFESWYQHKYDDLIQGDERRKRKEANITSPDENKRGTQPRGMEKVNSCKQIKSKRTLNWKHETNTKETNHNRSQLSRRQFHFHKCISVKDTPYWISLPLDLSSSHIFQEKKTKHEENALKKDLVEKINYSELEIKVIKSTFNEYAFDKKIEKHLTRFQRKDGAHKIETVNVNLRELQTTKYLKILKDMKMLYDIESEVLDEVINNLNSINIDIKMIPSKIITIQLRYEKKPQLSNSFDHILKQFKNHRYKSLNSVFTKNIDRVFHVTEKECVLTFPKPLKTKKSTKKEKARKLIDNLTLSNGDAVINHRTLYPKYVERIIALTKQLREVLVVLQTLRNVELELPSQSDILDELVQDVTCPKVFENTEYDPFKNWNINFKTDEIFYKLPDFKINFKSKGHAPLNKKTIFKSKIPIVNVYKNKQSKKNIENLGKTSQLQKTLIEKNLTMQDSCTSELKLFDLPELNLIDSNTITKMAQNITEELKKIVELIYLNSKSFCQPTLNVKSMMSPIEIECITQSTCKPCIELQYKHENHIRYNLNFGNLLDVSCLKTGEHSQGQGSFLNQNFLNSGLIKTVISQRNLIQSTMKNILNCIMSTKPSKENLSYRMGEMKSMNGMIIKQQDHETKTLLTKEFKNKIQGEKTPCLKNPRRSMKQVKYTNDNYPACKSSSKIYAEHNKNKAKEVCSPQKLKLRSKRNGNNCNCEKNTSRKLAQFRINRDIFKVQNNNYNNRGTNEPKRSNCKKYGNILRTDKTSSDAIPATSQSTSKTRDDSPIRIPHFVQVDHNNETYTHYRAETIQKKHFHITIDTVTHECKYKSPPPNICQGNKTEQLGEKLHQNIETISHGLNCDSIMNLYLSLSSDTSIEGAGDYSSESSPDIKTLAYFLNQQDASKSIKYVTTLTESKKKGSPDIQRRDNSWETAGQWEKTQKYKSKTREKSCKKNDSILDLYKAFSSDTCVTLSSTELLSSIHNSARHKSSYGNNNFISKSRTNTDKELSDKDSILDLYLRI